MLAGSGLAALAHAPPNDPCLDYGTLPESSSSSGAVELWPPGVRCEYVVGGRVARSEFFGPSTGELYAWILAATLLAAIALLRRGSAPARGAAVTATLLAIAGVGWQLGGIQLAWGVPFLVGVPLAFALDHVLRPARARSAGQSLRTAIALAAIVFCAIFLTLAEPVAAIAIGILAGALAGKLWAA